MSDTLAPITPAVADTGSPSTGIEPAAPSGPVRGPRGQFLPRAGGEAKTGGEAGTVPASAPRPAKSKARPIRVKNAAPAKQPERVAAQRAKKEILQQAEQTANAITRMLVSAVVIGVGEEARPSPTLEKEIKDPMGRILERLTPETSEMLATYADPLMLVTAFVAWGVQISRVMAVRKEAEEAESDNTVPFRPVKKPAERLPITPDDLKDAPEDLDGGNGHHEEEGTPVKEYTPTGESISPAEISSLMGDANGG
jgi:hypothetical protein